MRIIAIMGTSRKNGAGAQYVRQIEQKLAAVPGVAFEYVWLGDCHLQLCRGCRVCYERGEATCPLMDGYLAAMERLNGADAAIFYSPTYTLSISGLMKTFFDRSSYVLHRPYFKGRPALVLTAVDAWGQRPALGTLRQIVSLMGFTIAGALGIVNLRYETQPRYRARTDRTIGRMATRLAAAAGSCEPVRPSVIELVAFRFQKDAFGQDTDGCKNDKLYWRMAGWAAPQAVFYCPARISPARALAARALAWTLRKSGIMV